MTKTVSIEVEQICATAGLVTALTYTGTEQLAINLQGELTNKVKARKLQGKGTRNQDPSRSLRQPKEINTPIGPLTIYIRGYTFVLYTIQRIQTLVLNSQLS